MSNENIYKVITEKVIFNIEEALKNGTPFTWVKPWKGYPFGNFVSYQRNPEKFRPYRGINRILLEPGLYITMKQLNELSKKDGKQYKVKKGSHRETVYFYKKCGYKVKDEDGNVMVDDDGNESIRTFFLMRFYGVFNINDIEGLDDYEVKLEEHEYDETAMSKAADKIAKAYCKKHGIKLQIKKGIDKACYSPSTHTVTVPHRNQFTSLEEYYSTLFHELTHSTSYPLERELGSGFGTKKYSYEELIAELGALFMMQTIGFDTSKTEKNSTAYLKGWLKVLKSDVGFIVKASTAAQKAVDLILDINYEEDEEENAA